MKPVEQPTFRSVDQGRFQHGDPLLAYGQMMRAKKEAIHTSTVSSVLLEATRYLMNK